MATRHKYKKKSSSYSKLITITLAVSIVLIIGSIIGLKIGLVTWLINLVLLFLLVVAVCINGFLGYKLFTERTRESEERLYVEEQHNSQNFNDFEALRNSKKQLEKSYKRQTDEIEALKEKLGLLEQKLLKSASEKVDSYITQAPVHKSAQEKEMPAPVAEISVPKSNSLFFDGPYDDRIFSEVNAASEKKFRYVYRIEYNTKEPSHGKLFLEPAIGEYDILRSFSDTVLKPACTFENPFTPTFTKINQLSPGTVQKHGTDWIVKEKVRIQFN